MATPRCLHRLHPFLGALALAWCSGACAAAEERSTWERIDRTGIARVGYAVEPPFALVDSTGRVSGESPELLRLALAELGVDSIEWVATRFGSLILELQRGDFDVIAAGMYITPDRERSVLFTRPTLRDPAALLVRTNDASRVASLSDFLRDRTLRLAIISGAAEERLALSAGLERTQLRTVPDPATGRAAVQSADADAFSLSTVSLKTLRTSRADSADLVVVPLQFEQDSGLRAMALGRPAYAVRVEDTALRDVLNRALDLVIDTPAHRALQRRFGLDSTNDAPPRQTQPPGAARR